MAGEGGGADQIRDDIRQKEVEAKEARQKLLEEAEKFASERAAKAADGAAIVGAFPTSRGVGRAGSTVEGIADFFTGVGATNALATATSGLLHGGWSFIVSMAQKAAEKGMSGTVQNHMVKMAVQAFVKNRNPPAGTIGYFRAENENPDKTKNVTNSFMLVANGAEASPSSPPPSGAAE